jgi:hypothetical protein
MTKILAIEMAALLIALISIGAADFVYHGGRITQRLHSLWVSSSIAAMCMPVVAWVAAIFVGPGALAHSLAGIVVVALFVGLYRNLSNLPAIRRLGHGAPPPPPVEQTQPPASG